VWGPVQYKSNFSPLAEPAYDDGKLFVVTETGYLISLDATTGEQKWAEQLPDQTSFTSAPTAQGGVLYLVGTGFGGTLYAVDETTGNIDWTQSVNGDQSSPCLTANDLYVSFIGPQTYAFLRATGAQLWNFTASVEGGGGGTSVYSDGNLYVMGVLGGQDGYRLDASTGAVKGTFESGAMPAVDGKIGFLVLHDALQSENMITQKILWTQTLSEESIGGALIVVNHVVYCVTSANMLRGYDEATGNPVYAATLPDSPVQSLSAAQGLLIVPTSTHLVAYQ
jgi:outer membrane protein assembly factor BamB